MSRRDWLAVSALIVLLTAFITWPQPLHLTTRVLDHADPYFSLWRLNWIAHALRTDPRRLFDANIFYPARNTLAYSDATLIEGLLAAPFLWAHANPVLVYNVLLLFGIAASGLAMFVLARYLTGDTGAALVGAAIYTLVPYRVEHMMHLELQWTMWLPLAFWAMHRAVAEESWRFGVLAGFFIAMQILSCVYYGVFLVFAAIVLGVLLLATSSGKAVKGAAALALGGIVSLALTWPYALPYLQNARVLGPRDTPEFSARMISYLTAPRGNWFWGWTSGRFLGDELHLFPGLVAVMLALVGATWRPRRASWIYLAIGAIAVELSLGFGGHVYPWLYAHIKALGSLRSLARFSIVAFVAMAVLAAFGIERLQEQLRDASARRWLCGVAIVLIALEGTSAPLPLVNVPAKTPPLYEALGALQPGVTFELPIPQYDAWYEYWSKAHWNPLVNGYSGYASGTYLEALDWMPSFPDDRTVARLRRLHVRYIVVHEGLFKNRSDFVKLAGRILSRHEIVPIGHYKDWLDDSVLFELK